MTETEHPKSRLSTRLRLVFGMSLALNFLVIGLLVGAAFRFADTEGRRLPPHTLGTAMYREMPRADRAFLRKTSQYRAEHAKEFRIAEATAIADALRMTPFDRDAVQSVLDTQAEQRIGWQKKTQSAWLDRVSQMNVEDRTEYADRLYLSMTTPRGKEHRNQNR